MGVCLSSKTATLQEPIAQPQRHILKYSIIRMVRKLADIACVLFNGDSACIVLSAANEAIITDGTHEDPSWIDSWELVKSEHLVESEGVWVEHDLPDTHTGLQISWLAAALLPNNLGTVFVKGSVPPEKNCIRELGAFSKVIGSEFESVYSGTQSVEPRFIISMEDDVWPILWVNAPWVALTEVSTGKFWGNFTVLNKQGEIIVIAPTHRPLLHLTIRLQQCSPYKCFLGTVAEVDDNDMYSQASDVGLASPESVFDVSSTTPTSDNSTVRRVTWKSMDVALKVLVVDKNVDCKPVAVKLHAARPLTHINVARVLAADTRLLSHSQEVWVISEWCTGKTLTSAVQEDFFTIDSTGIVDYYRVLYTCKQIVQGLSFLHSQGYIHGNLHSSNVIICNDRTVKICDYGLCTLTPDLHLTVSEKSTSHLAPEQLQLNEVQAKTDQYAVGILMYEMLLRHPAWWGMSTTDVVQKKMENTFPELPFDVPPSLKAFVDNCTAFHHTDRPSWTEISRHLDDMLEQILAL